MVVLMVRLVGLQGIKMVLMIRSSLGLGSLFKNDVFSIIQEDWRGDLERNDLVILILYVSSNLYIIIVVIIALEQSKLYTRFFSIFFLSPAISLYNRIVYRHMN